MIWFYFSVRLELEYFDAVRFTVIDPMHNLFLGTANRLFQLWVEKDLLTKGKIKLIEERINKLDVGTGFGTLPHKIAFNHGKYKPSQWKNWTIIYLTNALVCYQMSIELLAFLRNGMSPSHCSSSFTQ